MIAKRDADLTSPDKNEVIPSETFIFHLGVGEGVSAARDIKSRPSPRVM